MKTLQGKKVLITREKQQATIFAKQVEALGGTALIADVLQITCNGAWAMNDLLLASYEWLFFTSVNGVNCFFKHVEDRQSLKKVNIAVVGHKTNQALKKYGFQATFIPSTYNAATMAQEFLEKYADSGKSLFVRGSKARPELVDAFQSVGKDFDIVEVYRTEVNQARAYELERIMTEEDPDYITFTSPSSVGAFCALYPGSLKEEAVIVPIGSTTTKAVASQGWTNMITPDEFTIEGMLDVMGKHALND